LIWHIKNKETYIQLMIAGGTVSKESDEIKEER